MLNVSSLNNEAIQNILNQALEIANGKEFKAKEFPFQIFFLKIVQGQKSVLKSQKEN